MRRGFTLIELVVAVAILALMSSFAGAIFSVSIDSHRTAMANAEIMRKLRAITDQLNADFAGLRKDGEIAIAWMAIRTDPNMNDPDRYIRFDRIMFFANGDFQTYHQDYGDIRANVARISYMLGIRRGDETGIRPFYQERESRILARTQHMLTSSGDVPSFPDLSEDPPNISVVDEWHNMRECDNITMGQWNTMTLYNKHVALATILDLIVWGVFIEGGGGTVIDPRDPGSIHTILCEGVGEFKVQGWYDNEQRWIPEIDRYGDGFLNEENTDFPLLPEGEIDDESTPGVWYNPTAAVGTVGIPTAPFDPNLLNEEHFNEIPGLGRALKFTFTLYDSRGIIKEGRTFTHIVYLDS